MSEDIGRVTYNAAEQDRKLEHFQKSREPNSGI